MIFRKIRQRWSAPGGYRELMNVATPLILSTSAWSIQHFVDRTFLTWYSEEAIAAALPAGILYFTLMSIFMGTAGYAATFVAQYYGAKRLDRIGPALWQGVYVALFAGATQIILMPLAGPIFNLIGHEAAVAVEETAYFRSLCWGGGPMVAASALAGFYAGRGKPWPIVWVNCVITVVNISLNYVLIFGIGFFPELGIMGAGIATAISQWAALGIYLYLLLSNRSHEEKYGLRSGWRFDLALFGRLIHFGFPSGAQFFLDIAGFTAFVLIVGGLGKESLAATNIAFNINTLAFMPMIGCGIAVSMLVGQYLGRNDPETAEQCVWSGSHVTLVYMCSIGLLYVCWPNLFIAFYRSGVEDKAAFAATAATVTVLLRFVALYSVFDTFNIIFSSALKGAGDTRFIMFMLMAVSLGGLVLPTWIVIGKLGYGLNAAFTIVSIYVVLLGLCFFARFMTGKWKSMRVIEEPVAIIPTAAPGAGADFEA